jgi:hypothetical protein
MRRQERPIQEEDFDDEDDWDDEWYEEDED